jgi:3-oxoadipate enol-lactonase
MEYQSVALAFEEYGQGPPVVFLHGYPLDHTIWQPLVPHLQNIARLILPDLRGFGKSPVPAGTYTMREMAEDVVGLLDQLEIEKAVLVGHSMGGYVSLAFAHAYPGRLAGLGLVATQAGADTPERRQSRLKTASAVKRRGVKPVVNSMLPKLTQKTELTQPLSDLMMQAQPAGVIGSLRGMAERPDMVGNLSNIAVPAVVLAGGADQILSLENMKTMAQMLPKGWLVEIPDGGHMLMMESPDQVAEALGQLIQMVGKA